MIFIFFNVSWSSFMSDELTLCISWITIEGSEISVFYFERKDVTDKSSMLKSIAKKLST